jgi:hypothetical protein
MKVHLIKSKELPVFKFNEICEYMKIFDGEIVFNSLDYEEVENESQEYEEDAELFKLTLEDNSPQNKGDFDRFFDQCEEYRKEQSISENELIILLTNEKNKNNFFGYPSTNMKNVFIQTSNWKDILGEGLDDVFPIVYEISAWTLRFLLFKSEGEMKTKISPKPVGCVMDMCKEKGDFSFKIRTGDIRPEVMELIRQRNINPAYINQLISIFEKIRSGVLFRQRVPITNQLTRLKLVPVGNKNKFKLIDFGDIELKMETMQCIIYTIFLLCEDGIRLQYINNHFNTVERVFNYFYLNKSEEHIEELVKKYCSKENNRLYNVNITNINKTLKLAIPENVLDQYLITKGKGDKFKIALDRNLVDLHIL